MLCEDGYVAYVAARGVRLHMLAQLCVQNPANAHVWLGAVDGIVYPATALLHANATPLGFGQQALWFGQERLDVLGEQHVPGGGRL